MNENELGWSHPGFDLEECVAGKEFPTLDEIQTNLKNIGQKWIVPTDSMMEDAYVGRIERHYYDEKGHYQQSNFDSWLSHAEWHFWLAERDKQAAEVERERIIALLEADDYLYIDEREAVIALIKGEQK